MYTVYTYQDWMDTPENKRLDFLLSVIGSYSRSDEFRSALTANAYFRSENEEIAKKYVMQPTRFETVDDETGNIKREIGEKAIVGARVFSNFFFRFVTQQNQYLLGNGVTLDDARTKANLGLGFDKALEHVGERALVQGVCWGFWNNDHLEAIEAAKDERSGFVALVDEETSEAGVGIQFWRIGDNRPMYVRLFEADGLTVYRTDKGGRLEVYRPKQAYRLTVARDAVGTIVTGEENYGALPVAPLYANGEKRSELTSAIKSKIDAYDRISSDFVDNLDRANDVYWVLNNFGGSTADMIEMIEQINQLRIVANISDGTTSSTVTPTPFEVPYAARKTALDLLEQELYQDYMALSMEELTGGSLTNVAIQAAMTNLNLKCDRYEWQCFRFVQRVLALVGVKTEEITFKRQTIVNETEKIDNIVKTRDHIGLKKSLELNPYIMQEEIPEIMQDVAAEQVAGLPSMQQLEAVAQEDE